MSGVATVRRWLATRHGLAAEAALVVALYAVYQTVRGLVAGSRDEALRHARDVVSVEQALHVFVEGRVQHAAEQVPGLIGALSFAYLGLHLAVTGAVLLWLHERRPRSYPVIRTALLVASALALVGYALLPTAPPRLSSLVAVGQLHPPVNIDKRLISALYDPYAAMPSMHVAYALVVGSALLLYARPPLVRAAGALYPALVVFTIVATGNHFVLDAAAGASVAAVAAVTAARLARQPVEVVQFASDRLASTAGAGARAQRVTVALPPVTPPALRDRTSDQASGGWRSPGLRVESLGSPNSGA